MPVSHEAGWAHADGALRGPAWLQAPRDVNALVPLLWSSTARKNDEGALEVTGGAKEVGAHRIPPEPVLGQGRIVPEVAGGVEVMAGGLEVPVLAQDVGERDMQVGVAGQGGSVVCLRGGEVLLQHAAREVRVAQPHGHGCHRDARAEGVGEIARNPGLRHRSHSSSSAARS